MCISDIGFSLSDLLHSLWQGSSLFTSRLTQFHSFLWLSNKVPWTPLKEISPGISLEGMMLKLKRQYFGHLMRRVDSLERLMLEGIGGRRRRGRQRWDGWMASRTRWTWVWVNSASWWWTGSLACCDSWGHKESDTTKRLHFHFSFIFQRTPRTDLL